MWNVGKREPFQAQASGFEVGRGVAGNVRVLSRCHLATQEQEAVPGTSSQRAAWFLEQAEKMPPQSEVKPQGSCKVAPEPRTEAKWPTSNVSFLNRGPGRYDPGTESTLRASVGLAGSSFLNRAPGQVLQQRTGSEAWLGFRVQNPFLLSPLRTSRRVEESSPRRGLPSRAARSHAGVIWDQTDTNNLIWSSLVFLSVSL